MKRQCGQSMAEYLVTLGIGGSIIAALTLLPCDEAGSARGCVPTLIDALHNNYEGYSAAIGAVQDYGDIDVAAPAEDDGDGIDDGVDDTGGGDDLPTSDELNSLAKVNTIYDADGNALGTVVGDTIYDADGNPIGEYIFDAETGKQTAVIDGQVYDGISVSSTVVGSDGNPVELKAFVVGGQVVGFGYYDNGKYYDAVNADQTTAVPSSATVGDLRTVNILDGSGSASLYGYEYGGYVYSLAKVQVYGETYQTTKVPDGELVEVRLSEVSSIVAWSGYSTCIVRSLDWVNNELSGYPGSGDYTFAKTEDDGSGNQISTSNNSLVESPTSNAGYIDTADIGSGGCQGRWILQEGAGDWTLSGPY